MILDSLIVTLIIGYLLISGIFIGFWFCFLKDINWLLKDMNWHSKWNWLLIISYLVLAPYLNWLIFSPLDQVVNQQFVNQVFSYLLIAIVWLPLATGLMLGLCMSIYYFLALIANLISSLDFLRCNCRWWFWIKRWKWTNRTFKPFYRELRNNQVEIQNFYIFQTAKTTYNVYFDIKTSYSRIILQSNQLDDLVNLDFYQKIIESFKPYGQHLCDMYVYNLIWDFQLKQIYFSHDLHPNLIISYQIDQDPFIFLKTQFSNCLNQYQQVWQILKSGDNLEESNRRALYYFFHQKIKHFNWSHLKINAAQEIIWQYQSKHNLQVYQQHFSLIESKPNPKDTKDKAPEIDKHQQPLQISQITKIGSVPTSKFNKGVKND